jgi:transcriptional regulator GlxA family with amidase domain
MHDIKEASRVLEENITSIRTVAEWAEAMGYADRKKFSRVFRKQFGYRPREAFQEIRAKKIQEYFKHFPDEKNYCIAIEFGFADEQGLYKFFKRHIGLSPTEWRKRLVKKASQKG